MSLHRPRARAEAGSLAFTSAPPPDDSPAPRPPPRGAGLVLAFGWNGHGQLGVGDCHERALPSPLRSLAAAAVAVRSVACGSTHSLAVDVRGAAWAWGDNHHGQLGTGDRRPRLEPCELVVEGQRVTMAACGAHHSLLGTSRGRVVACGSHSRGQLGLGVKDEAKLRDDCFEWPTVVRELSGSRVTAVAAGFAHSLFLTTSGRVLSSGAGDCGQLGLGGTNDVASPEAVSAVKESLIAVVAGNYHSCALTEERAVYSWGEGRFGRLGHGTAAPELLPRLIHGLFGLRIATLACGGACTAAIDEFGRLYTWGSSTWDQCAHSGPAEQFEPKRVAALEGVALAKVDCAEDHMVALSTAAQVFAWGRDTNGRLGGAARCAKPSPPVLRVTLPPLDGLAPSGDGSVQVVSVCCKGAHSLLLTHPGELPAEHHSSLRGGGAGALPSAAHSLLDAGEQRVRATAGHRCVIQIISRDAEGHDCPTGAYSYVAWLEAASAGSLAAHSSSSGNIPPSASAPILPTGKAIPPHALPSSRKHASAASAGLLPVVSAEEGGAPPGALEVQDLGGGVHAVSFVETRSASYMLHVRLLPPGVPPAQADSAGEAIVGSPAHVIVTAAACSAADCELTGAALSGAAVAGARASFSIVPRDKFGNRLRSGGTLPFEVALRSLERAGRAASALQGATVARQKDGTHLCSFQSSTAGRIAVFVKLRGEEVAGTPFFVQVSAGPASAERSALVGKQAWSVRVGKQFALEIQAADSDGNARPRGSDRIAVQVCGPSAFPFEVEALEGGRYRCTGTPSAAGQHYVTPMLNGSERLAGAPFRLEVLPLQLSDVAARLELHGDGMHSALQGEPARFVARAVDQTGATLAAAALGRGVTLRCALGEPEGGEAEVTEQEDGSFAVEYTPRHAGAVRLHLSLGAQLADDSHVVRVFLAAAWSFYQLGLVAVAEPHARLPDGFYELPPVGFGTPSAGRPFALLSELREAPYDPLPAVLSIERGSDLGLQLAAEHACRALQAAGCALPPHGEPPPPAAAAAAAAGRRDDEAAAKAYAALLAAFVSSWLGGQWGEAEEAEAARRLRAAREARGANVVPLGGIRRGGQRPRALLYKVLYDELLCEQPAGCELRRSHHGRLECWLRSADPRVPPQQVHLFTYNERKEQQPDPRTCAAQGNAADEWAAHAYGARTGAISSRVLPRFLKASRHLPRRPPRALARQ
ncbi:hypothetical protein AB1Y20_006949 [Prymnesium parvum]|uniref:RCR-type E3 ubiquitin transferase n=1 Tax=Prymnesium parvum TaxID=97485 RepID=A0AB34J262_PRYPA